MCGMVPIAVEFPERLGGMAFHFRVAFGDQTECRRLAATGGEFGSDAIPEYLAHRKSDEEV